MSSFTSGWSCWYCFAAASRVESTQTVNAPSFWGAWAKPSLVVLPVLVPVPPQAATGSIIVAAQPASRAEPLVLRTLFRAAEDFWAVMSDSTARRSIGPSVTVGPTRRPRPRRHISTGRWRTTAGRSSGACSGNGGEMAMDDGGLS